MAAKTKSSKDVSKKIINTKVSRPGVHSKKRNSVLKSSKNWKKPYRGQGR
jgi:hypothetical protein